VPLYAGQLNVILNIYQNCRL